MHSRTRVSNPAPECSRNLRLSLFRGTGRSRRTHAEPGSWGRQGLWSGCSRGALLVLVLAVVIAEIPAGGIGAKAFAMLGVLSAATTGLCVLIVGPAVLTVFRRAARRADFEAPVTFTAPRRSRGPHPWTKGRHGDDARRTTGGQVWSTARSFLPRGSRGSWTATAAHVYIPVVACDGRSARMPISGRFARHHWEGVHVSAITVGQAVVLGIVEGVTEFLPVSSTGHLKITEGLMGIPVDDTSVVGFTAVIQVGAIAAVLLYFLKDIVRIASAWGRGLVNREERHHHDYKFGWWVIYATIPIVVVGLAAKPLIKGALASLWVVAGSLIVGSAVMWAADQIGRHKRGEDDISFKDAMIVGAAQILALLFPGFSRSGATMSAGLMLDLDRVAATRLSFFLGIPALTGAGLYELKDALGAGVGTMPLVVGTAVSFVVAYASIAWLLKYVAKHSFNAFVVYRIVIGVILFGLLGTGVLNA